MNRIYGIYSRKQRLTESQAFLQRLRHEYLCNNFRINFIFRYKLDNSPWKLKYWKSDLSRSVLQRKS